MNINKYLPSLYRFIIRSLMPISKIVGKIHIAPKSREIKASDVLDILHQLVPGDIILSYSKGELTNFLIEGEYKHCGIYFGNGYLYEAVGRGVVETVFEDFCSSKDKIAVCRPKFCDRETMQLAANFAKDQFGKPYDYQFEPTERAFYCAELASESYRVVTNNKSPFIPREILGVETVLPSDFKLAKSKFDVVIERPVI